MKNTSILSLLFALSLLIFSSCKGQDKKSEQSTTSQPAMQLPAVNAPEINTKYGWLNTDKEFSIKDFRGKILLLDFWTFGCINCQHIIPDLKRLEKEYEKEL